MATYALEELVEDQSLGGKLPPIVDENMPPAGADTTTDLVAPDAYGAGGQDNIDWAAVHGKLRSSPGTRGDSLSGFGFKRGD